MMMMQRLVVKFAGRGFSKYFSFSNNNNNNNNTRLLCRQASSFSKDFILPFQVQNQKPETLAKLIKTYCNQTKFIQTLNVPPRNLINFFKFLWKDYHDLIINAPVLETLVSSLCSNNKISKKDMVFLWNFLQDVGNYDSNLLNANILNKLIHYFSIMPPRQGNINLALDVFHKFELFQCAPNHDTYYFTLQALMTTKSCNSVITNQAASLCRKMLLLQKTHHQDYYDHNILLPPPGHPHQIQLIIASIDFNKIMGYLSCDHGTVVRFAVNKFMDSVNRIQCQQEILLKIIETSCQTKLVETPNVSFRNLISFVEWVWKNNNNNNNLINTHVIESLVNGLCTDDPSTSEVRNKDLFFLWEFLKDIGHCQIGLLNTTILNQLLNTFGIKFEKKAAFEVFEKFEVFQCLPNKDTYIFTLRAIFRTKYSTTDELQLASSICQKMVLHSETLLPEDNSFLGQLSLDLSRNNMIKEVHALYVAANEKRKRNPNWLPHRNIIYLLPQQMFAALCSKKETIHLAMEILNDNDFPEEPEERNYNSYKLSFCLQVVKSLCWFKDLDAAKQWIFKMAADGPLPRPSEAILNVMISSYVKAGEIEQAFEILILSESIGLKTYDVLTNGHCHSYGIVESKKILEVAKKKDSKLFIALLYHTLIVTYCNQHKFDEAHKFMIQMKKDLGFFINLDTYHKLIHSLRWKSMNRKLPYQQLGEMAREKLHEEFSMEKILVKKKLEEMNHIIRETF